jgi:uncharacterized protein with gpF-like domain
MKVYRELIAPAFRYESYEVGVLYLREPRPGDYLPALTELYTEIVGFHYRDIFRKFQRGVKKEEDLHLIRIQEYINLTAFPHAEMLDETSREIIRAFLINASETGVRAKNLAEKFAQILPGMSADRAMTIIRTEMTAARNWASIQAADDNDFAYTKIWSAGRDKRVRPAHRKANGQRRRKDKLFMVGGVGMKHPGDPAGGADNVVRCRCAVIYEVTDADLGLDFDD